MTYSGPKVFGGVSGQVLNSIPKDWSQDWFRNFLLGYLQFADVRNAVGAGGVTVSGTVGQNATITGSGGSSGANPTAVVGLSAVNGSATTFLRSDGAPPLDVSINPTWTGQHTFTPGPSETAVIVNTTANNVGVSVRSGAGSGAIMEVCGDGSGTGNGLSLTQTSVGAGVINLNFNAALTFKVNGTNRLVINADGGLLVGAPTGGVDEGAGTINAQGLFVNGSATVPLNGSPTWTGNHTFTPASGVGVTINAKANVFGEIVNGSSTSGQSFGLEILAGTTSADNPLLVANQANTATFLEIFGDGHGSLGPGGSQGLTWTANGAFTIAAPAIAAVALTIDGPANQNCLQMQGSSTSGQSFGLRIDAGTTSADWAIRAGSQGGTQYFLVAGDGSTTVNASGTKVGFYGISPVAQRATTSLQRTTNVSTVTGTISVSTAAINSIANSLKEVMNTLAAYGLWSIS